MPARKKPVAPAEADMTTAEVVVPVEAAANEAASSSGPGAAAAVLQLVRENPVPTGIVWAGLGWLVLSAAGAKRPQTGGAQQAVTGAAGRTRETVAQVAAGAQSRGQSVATAAQQRVQGAAGRAGEALGSARFFATTGARTVKSRATIQAERAGSAIQSLKSERPEVLELGAAAAGVAVGLIIPATQPERQLVAPRREQIIEKVDTAAERVLEKVEQTLEPTGPPPADAPAILA